MSKVDLKHVIQAVKTYLEECLPTKAKSIKIKKDEILSHGNVIQRAYFLLSDCPEYKIKTYDKAKLVQFHGSCKGTLPTRNGSQEIDRDPGVEILDQYNNPLLTFSSSNITLLLDNLRANLIFVPVAPASNPVPVAPASNPTTKSDVVSILQKLDKTADNMSQKLRR
jgi:hypothetical protein